MAEVKVESSGYKLALTLSDRELRELEGLLLAAIDHDKHDWARVIYNAIVIDGESVDFQYDEVTGFFEVEEG